MILLRSIVIMIALLFAGQLHALSGQLIERMEEQELLLDLWLENDLAVSEDFIGYISQEGGILVPLGAFCRMIGLAITVDVDGGSAEGFILDENQRFYLDLADGEVTIAGTKSSFPEKLVERHFDDVYVESSLLSQWFPLQLQIDQLRSRAHVYPQKPLPMQERWERELRYEQSATRRSAREALGYPVLENEYSAWSGPFIDESLNFRLTRKKDGETTPFVRHATLATMDISYWNALVFFTGDNKTPISDHRLTLSRKDPDGDLLGPLKARHVAFGDINTDGMTLLHKGSAAKGVLLSNYPSHHQGQFSSQDFSGDALPGWDVELYRNGVLLDYQRVGEDGRYRFDGVALLYGANVFRLALYGPQGQKHSEIRRFNIARPLVSPGENLYRFTASQTDNGLERLSGEYRIAINDSMTFDAGMSTWRLGKDPLSDPEGEEPLSDSEASGEWVTQGMIGLHAYHQNWFGSVTLAMDVDGAAAAQLDLLGRFGGVNLSLQHKELKGFLSEKYSLDKKDVRRSDKVKLDGYFKPGKVISGVSYSLSALREEKNDGSVFTEFGNRISLSNQHLSVSNEVALSMENGKDSESSLADGNLRLRLPIIGWNTGGEITYEMTPETTLKQVGLAADRDFDNGYQVRLGVNHQMEEAVSDVTFSLSKKFKHFTLSSTFLVTSEGDLNAGLNFTTAAARDSTGKWSLSAKPIAEKGGASVMAFLDTNRNGVQDPDEKNVEDIGLRVNGGTAKAFTHADGNTVLHGLPANRWGTVSLSDGDLDPAWHPTRRGVRLVPRPGTMPVVSFPLVIVGEIDGTVSFRQHGRVRGIGDVEVQLIDQAGKVIKQVKTAYDGFYLFTGVHPGQYRVRIDQSQVDRLKLGQLDDQPVVMDDDGPVISGVNFELYLTGDKVLPKLDDTPEPISEAETWVVQAGSFSDRGNADRMVAKLREKAVPTLMPQAVEISGKTLFRVLVGPAETRQEADSMLEALQRVTGQHALKVRSYVQTPATHKQLPSVVSAERKPVPTVSAWVVQAGSFSSLENAGRMIAQLRKKGLKPLAPRSVKVAGKTHFRVLLGSADSRQGAEVIREDLERVTGRSTLLVRPVDNSTI